MVEITSRQVNDFLLHPPKNLSVAIFFGPDHGLISQRAKKLASQLGNEQEIVRLHNDELVQNIELLIDGVTSLSMFAEQQVYHLVNMDKALHSSISNLLTLSPGHHPVIIEAPGKTKTDKSIKLALSEPQYFVIGCYQETSRQSLQHITSALKQKGHKFAQGCEDNLAELLGEDHLLTVSALNSLDLYLGPEPQEITPDMIAAALGQRQSIASNFILESMTLGRRKLIQQMHLAQNQNLTIPAILYHLERDLEISQKIQFLTTKGLKGKSLFAQMKPRIHFSRETFYLKASNIFGGQRGRDLLKTLYLHEELHRRDDKVSWSRLERILLRFTPGA
ncbi:MAG: DNA polymerase III subunit delta [Alphaproteobacteria bacterium]